MLDTIKKKIFLPLRKLPFIFDRFKKMSRLLGNTNEEYELLKEYKKGRNNIAILQIGANDGISNDPVREFLVAGTGWYGYLIEPIPHLFDKLQKNYRGNKNVQLIQCAVSDKTGKANIYSFKKSELKVLPFYADQIASFDKEHLVKHFPGFENIESLIEEISVDTFTMEGLIERYKIEKAAVLIIDVEGHEKQLIPINPLFFLY
jgi:FkbM family methyltransferase